MTVFKETNFFAIVNSTKEYVEISRLKLNREAQVKLCEAFSENAKKFIHGDIEEVVFDGKYKPDENEILTINSYAMPKDILSALEEPTAVDELIIDEDNLPKIKGIFTGIFDGANPTIAFQNFNQSQYLSKTSRLNLFHSENTFKLIEGTGISIPYRVDSLYYNNKLLFFSFWHTKQIVDLSEYYREATDADIKEFMSHNSIYISEPDSFYSYSDNWIRRKIAFLRDSRMLDKIKPSNISEKAASYEVEINYTVDEKGNEQIVLPDDKQKIKEVLRFLDHDIYSSPITEERFISNSKRPYKK